MSNEKRVGFVSVGLVGVAGALVAGLATLAIAYLDPGLLGLQPIRGNSPIKVQGGSMSVSVKKSTGPWQVESVDAKNNPTEYCLAYAPTQISLNDAVPETSGNPIQFPTSSTGTLTAWTLTLYGADPTQNVLSPSHNGFMMQESTNPCKGATASGYALHLTLVQNAAFYPIVKQEKDNSTAVRFEDTTPGVGGAPSICSGPDGNPNGDEDGCERLSQIAVTIGATSYGLYDCQARDCSVDVGP
jgi:hypothetical protein